MVLPEGFGLPPVPYLVGLLVATAGVGLGLWRADPSVGPKTVLGLTPWMALGGGLHVLSVLTVAPPSIDPLLGTPAVYLTTAIVAGLVWLIGITLDAGGVRSPAWLLGVTGAFGVVLLFGVVIWTGAVRESLAPTWPLVAVLVSVALTGVIWWALRRQAPQVAAVTSWAGLVVIFGHVIDGISTAIGIDVLDGGERSPLPRAIMDLAAQLPTADLIGVGWLFVVVKIAIAVAIVWFFVPFVRDAKRQGCLLLTLLAAVGLGPGVHNVLLFLVAG